MKTTFTFEDLIASYNSLIYKTIRAQLDASLRCHDDLVDDIRQETLIVLLEKYRAGEFEANDSHDNTIDSRGPLIRQIAINRTIDEVRKLSLRKYMCAQFADHTDVYEVDVVDNSDDIDPLKRERETLKRFLSWCADDVANVFECRMQGMSLQRIADELGFSVSKVQNILTRYTKKFREMADVDQ